MTIANPRPYYHVEVIFEPAAGAPITYTVHRDPALPDPVPGYGLADPLRVGWQLPNTGQLYVQPDPMWGTITLLVANLTDVARIEENVPVSVEVSTWPAGTVSPVDGGVLPSPVFGRGVVTNVDAEPHKLGSLVTITWVDPLVEQNERDVGTMDWPAETADVRAERIGDQLGFDMPTAGITSLLVDLAARTATPTPGLEYLVSVLNQCAEQTDPLLPDVVSRPYVGSDWIGGTLDLANPPVQLVHWSSRQTVAVGELPGKLALVGAVYGVVIDTTLAAPAAVGKNTGRIIDACHVERGGVSYRLAKSERPDTYAINGPYADGSTQVVVAEADAKPIRASIDTELTDPADATALGRLNLNGRASDGWAADKFIWHADLDPTTLVYPYLMFQNDWFYSPRQSYAPVVIAGLPAAQNPSGETWFAGQLTSAVFTLARGRYSVELTTRRNLPVPLPVAAPPNGGYLSPSKMTGTLAAIKPTQLDPRLTAFDARLLRSDY